MITSFAAATWFFTYGYDLVSPRVLYIIKITMTITVNLIFCWCFGMGCYRIYSVTVHKDRYDGIKTRILNGAIGVALLAMLYYVWDFPTRLPEDIRKIASLVFGDGLYY